MNDIFSPVLQLGFGAFAVILLVMQLYFIKIFISLMLNLATKFEENASELACFAERLERLIALVERLMEKVNNG